MSNVRPDTPSQSQPASGPSNTNAASSNAQKADTIAYHFYTKLFYVVQQARGTSDTRTTATATGTPAGSTLTPAPPVASGASAGAGGGAGGGGGVSSSGTIKTDKWFNLETPDYSDLFTKEAREPYKSLSSYQQPQPQPQSSSSRIPIPPSIPIAIPPLEIQVLLSIPDLTLTPNQVLVSISPDSSRIRIEPTPRYILLESWVLAFSSSSFDGSSASSSADSSGEVSLPTIYKHGIPLFRSLYSLLRVLPAWRMFKRLRRRPGMTGAGAAATAAGGGGGAANNTGMGILLRVRGAPASGSTIDERDILLFGTFYKISYIYIHVTDHTSPLLHFFVLYRPTTIALIPTPPHQITPLPVHPSPARRALFEGNVPVHAEFPAGRSGEPVELKVLESG
jgi:autophagy-related protein 13